MSSLSNHCSVSGSSADECGGRDTDSRHLHSSHWAVRSVALCQGSRHSGLLHQTGIADSYYTDRCMVTAGTCICWKLRKPHALLAVHCNWKFLHVHVCSNTKLVYEHFIHVCCLGTSKQIHVHCILYTCSLHRYVSF